MSLHHWHQGHSLAVGSVHDPEFRMFHAAPGHYEDSINHQGGPLISPPMTYVSEPTWPSDMDLGTPSTAGFPDQQLDAYHAVRHTSITQPHLHHPQRYSTAVQSQIHSPPSSYGELIPVKEERPSVTRSTTAPAPAAPRPRPIKAVKSSSIPSLKRSGSEDEDEEFVPVEEAKPRGRKRQRIPHTAVERRYRENLNAHLDKLRQTVPTLASKRAPGGGRLPDGLGEGVKPSKCEILNGAIEHIGALGRENAALMTEVKALRSRLEDLERWCNSAGFAK
jgi:hypothetical protein